VNLVSKLARGAAARFIPGLNAAVRCGGCGRTKPEAVHLVAGPDVYLCSDCFQKAARVLAPRRPPADAVRCRFCRQPRPLADVTSVGTVTVCADCLGLIDDILTDAVQPLRPAT